MEHHREEITITVIAIKPNLVKVNLAVVDMSHPKSLDHAAITKIGASIHQALLVEQPMEADTPRIKAKAREAISNPRID